MSLRIAPKLLAAAAFAAAFALGPTTAATSADRTISLGVGYPTDAVSAEGVKFWAEKVEEYSGGELDVEIFWNSQLGNAREMVQGVATGAIDAHLDVIELLVTFEPKIGALSLPLVFRDRDHFSRFVGSDVFAEMLDGLEDDGIIFPARDSLKDPVVARNWTRPFDRGVVSKRPVFTPADLEGFKLRMYESEIPVKSWEALGASVQIVPWPDVYTALATGVVDGLTGTVSDNVDWKHFENAPYWTNIHEYFQMSYVWVSKLTWDTLSDSQKAAIDKATEETSYKWYEIQVASDAEAKQKAQELYGVSFITPPIAPWIDKMGPTHADFEARGLVEKGLIGRMQAVE